MNTIDVFLSKQELYSSSIGIKNGAQWRKLRREGKLEKQVYGTYYIRRPEKKKKYECEQGESEVSIENVIKFELKYR